MAALALTAAVAPENKARLAQSVEGKALNLVVVGSSPTVGAISAWPERALAKQHLFAQ